jgi:hypothetical protein
MTFCGWDRRDDTQSGILRARQTVGQNVRGHPLFRPGQQVAEVMAVAEHQVAGDDQALIRIARFAA